MHYDVLMDGKPVGRAEVIREGMYFRICCRCDLPEGKRYRVTMTMGEKHLDLGLCVSYGRQMGLSARVPVRSADRDLSFSVAPHWGKGCFVPVREDRPFGALDKLSRGIFGVQAGQPGIYITDSVSILPDSDQSPGSDDKWAPG